MKEMKDLQKLIEERAEKKLTNELKAFAKSFHESPLMCFSSSTEENMLQLKIIVNAGTSSQRLDRTTIRDLFTVSGYDGQIIGDFLIALYTYWLPIYIERESAEFLKKVDSLQREVDELYNATQTYKP